MIKAEDLPEDEKIYFKKDIFGYRIIYPIKNEDGTTNWFNLLTGGKRNLFMLGIYLIIAMIILYGVNDIIDKYKYVHDNPCEFCHTCGVTVDRNTPQQKVFYPPSVQINVSEILEEGRS